MNKPVIEFLTPDKVKLTGKNLVIVIERVNGLIRFNHDISIIQLEEVDANAFSQAIEGLIKSQ